MIQQVSTHGKKARFIFSLLFVWMTAMVFLECAKAGDMENYTHKLTQSSQTIDIWTTPPAERVFQDDAVPEETGDAVKVYCAKNEYEPFVVAVKPDDTQSLSIGISDFGSGIRAEIFRVEYVTISQVSDALGRTGPYPDPLWPLENPETVSCAGGVNTAFWFSLYVPETAPAGDYTANVTIGTIQVPVHLHVFNFTVSEELHVKSQMNLSFNAFLDHYSVPGTQTEYWMYVNMIRQFMKDHRLTPKSPLWPGGLTNKGSPFIKYNCTTGDFTDEDGIWGFEIPAQNCLEGNAMRSNVGFPSFMAITFANNDPSSAQRPSSFCGQTLTSADAYTQANPDTPYNDAWFTYMGHIEDYLQSLGYLEKAYYYLANEPQDQADYDAVAWFSQEIKKEAPNLKLMVSEEPRPEIYSHPTHTGAKIDIWLPVLHSYDPDVSHAREKNFQEETWIYFLYGTRPPYFNPVTLDHPGIEARLTGWFLWKYRVKGIAYYSMNTWSKNPWTDPMTSGHNGDLFMIYPPAKNNSPVSYGSNNHRLVPSIRLELLREGLEDYEYLYLLSGGAGPVVDVENTADPLADKIITGLTSYTRDGEFMANLRRLMGMKIGGEISQIPDINPPALHPRAEGLPGNYYINFQDPQGEPSQNPLVVDGKTYMKIGWEDYDQDAGYGWYSSTSAYWMGKYVQDAPNVLQASVIFSDWGRPAVFEFDLPGGTYNVTLSLGWHGRTYSSNRAVIEGVTFVDDEATDPYIVRTKEVAVTDNKLTLDIGIFDEYTMLNYMNIEAVGGTGPVSGDINCDGVVDIEDGIRILGVVCGRSMPQGAGDLRGDADESGEIDSGDAVFVLQKIAGIR